MLYPYLFIKYLHGTYYMPDTIPGILQILAHCHAKPLPVASGTFLMLCGLSVLGRALPSEPLLALVLSYSYMPIPSQAHALFCLVSSGMPRVLRAHSPMFLSFPANTSGALLSLKPDFPQGILMLSSGNR